MKAKAKFTEIGEATVDGDRTFKKKRDKGTNLKPPKKKRK